MSGFEEKVPLLENNDKDVFNMEEGQAIEATAMTVDGDQQGATSCEDNEDVMSFVYDVFISYSKSDRPWVKDVLLQILEKEGKKVCIDYRDFQIGGTVTDNIVHAIENSHVTILVLTPSFVESDWCMYESKQALVTSLNKSRARILPLVLMEAELPSILQHLTHLDYTNEDVQPYFKEQLIDSLNNAKKWIPVTDKLGCEIIPVSEVEEVVARTLEQNNRNKYVFKQLMSTYKSFTLWKFLIRFCIIFSFCMILIVGIVCSNIFLKRQESHTSTFELNNIIRTPSQFFAWFLVGDYFSYYLRNCQSLSIVKKNSKKPILFDAFRYKETDNEKIIYIKEKTWYTNTSLSQNSIFKPYNLSVYGDMLVRTKFCFHSQNPEQNASLRLYKPTSTNATNQFCGLKNFNLEMIIGVKYQEFKSLANQTTCGYSLIKGRSIKENEKSTFVFHNLGNATILLNMSIAILTLSFRESLAKQTCRHVTQCDFPSFQGPGYIIISNTYTSPNFENDIIVKCVDKTPVIFFCAVLSILSILVILSMFQVIVFVNKTSIPSFKKWYFQREKIRKRFGDFQVKLLVESRSHQHFRSIISRRVARRENLTLNM